MILKWSKLDSNCLKLTEKLPKNDQILFKKSSELVSNWPQNCQKLTLKGKKNVPKLFQIGQKLRKK